MISALLVLLLFFVGVSESGGIFWRAVNCESPLVYCMRERLYTFCVDFKEYTVRWKFHLECLSRSSCFYGGDFPCKTAPRLPDFRPVNESGKDVITTTTSSSQSSSSFRRKGLWKKPGTSRSAGLVRSVELDRKNARSPSLVSERSKTSPKLPDLHFETGFGKIAPSSSSSQSPELYFRSKTGFKRTTSKDTAPSFSPPNSATSWTLLKATVTGRSSVSYGPSRESLVPSSSSSPAVTALNFGEAYPENSEATTKVSGESFSSTINFIELHQENLKTITKTTSPSSVFDVTTLLEVGVPVSDAPSDSVLPKSIFSYERNAISSSIIINSSEVHPEILRTPATVLTEEPFSQASSDVFGDAATTLEEQVTLKVSTTEKPKPTPPTACQGEGRYPGRSCNEYYECVVVWWWFELVLRFCAEGFAFSVANRTCVPTADSDCLN